MTEDKFAGVLLGVALGDALGLPAEGMSPRTVKRRFGAAVDRFHLLGRTGFVSDDTEQSALVAQALLRSPAEPARDFRWALLGWFWRLPFGIGLATVRAAFRIMLGFDVSGVRSAGNGAAMRAAIIGVAFADDSTQRASVSDAIARVTHIDDRAVEAARFVAEVAARCLSSTAQDSVRAALAVVRNTQLRAALEEAVRLAESGATVDAAVAKLGTTGFVIQSVPFATYCFAATAGETMHALQLVISGGGDTDTNAAIVGGWCGALNGAAALPTDLLSRINDGPFGPTHLRALGSALAAWKRGETPPRVRYSWVVALLRNLALYPVVLAHGFRRLIPF